MHINLTGGIHGRGFREDTEWEGNVIIFLIKNKIIFKFKKWLLHRDNNSNDENDRKTKEGKGEDKKIETGGTQG